MVTLSVLELDAVFVADAVERRQNVGGEFSGLLQHGGGDVAVEIAVMAGLDGGLQARAVIEGQQHVVDRRAVGHGGVSLSGNRRAAVFPRNPGSLNSQVAKSAGQGSAKARAVRAGIHPVRLMNYII